MRFTHNCVLNFGSIQTKIAYFLLIKTFFLIYFTSKNQSHFNFN